MRRTTGLALRAIVVVGVLAVAPSAYAAKHTAGAGGSGGGTYAVSVSPAGPYNFGEKIYVTTNAPIYPNNQGPWIELRCYKNGALVATDGHAGFPAGWYYNWPFYLGPSQSWTSGAADCTVTVVHQSHNKVVTDATKSFHVYA
ncbi:MAG: hypothetical protein M3Q30_05510 [Actinomycetota bacterium]|nr:hypothetical protein [Actinomycetota bacterium]